ncbi:ATP-dependent DNA helicase Rep, partial [Stenotrophomonas sp. HMWF022]
AELASEKDMPMAQAAEAIGALQQLPPRAANSLARFTDILRDLRAQTRQISSGDMIRKVAKESGLLSELRQQAKEEASYQRRANNIEELAQWFEGGPRGATAADLAGQLALLSRSDKDEGGNQVRMMTMHGSKGLEFPYVFIVGCEDGVLPHQVSLDEGNLQEERRLLYVGITRAKIQLWMSYSKLTRKFGEHVRLKPSRFFEEIPAEEIQRDGADPVADAARKKERATAGLAAIEALFD